MRLFTTSRTLAGLTSTAMLSTASSLRQPRSRRITARRKNGSMASAGTPPRSSYTSLIAGIAATVAANDSCYFAVALDDKVRILRSDASDHARMVLSGRMADVCAALERMCLSPLRRHAPSPQGDDTGGAALARCL